MGEIISRGATQGRCVRRMAHSPCIATSFLGVTAFGRDGTADLRVGLLTLCVCSIRLIEKFQRRLPRIVPSSLQTGADEISHCFPQETGRWYVSRASSGKGQSVNHMEAQFSPTMDFSHSSGGTSAEVFFCAFTVQLRSPSKLPSG